MAESVPGSSSRAHLSETPPKVIDSQADMSELVDTLQGLPIEPPSLYIDLEGINLSRQGTIAILQVFVRPSGQTYLIDVKELQDKSFSTRGEKGLTFKDILESESIPKVFFDVRNDSDALYSHFKIHLGGIQDLQLMELATRTFSRRCVNGLSKCIERDAPFSYTERNAWMQSKERGLRLFAPERGGSYEVFTQRPLPDDIIYYCANDVQVLPRLWTQYNKKLTSVWKEKVWDASRDRVKLSQSPTFDGKGRHMALGPKGW
ncbi:hypothetical protein QQS21_011345 [Conoideocrella luteorostrata]|uniref:3'-5' exonuclease domain-containing protein n=1 Tax=Conoideocrella luteorostrata TaxID=1105319 RepID=A0AAJ0FNG9_9HYPO|nr:hypothetical protein QQS21_011345 [Conoideocrella luteorostrata]